MPPPGGTLSIAGRSGMTEGPRTWSGVEGRHEVPRLFVALELPEALKEAIVGLQTGLRDARWLGTDALHLTLAFIGEVDGSAGRRIEEALSRVEAPPVEVELHGLGHFPLRGPPRVLWTGAAPAEALGALAAAVRRALARAGYPPERRKFAPHVTIARFRRPPPAPALQDYLGAYSLFRTPAAPVDSFRLLSSILRPSGARYTLEADFPLIGVPPPSR